MAIALECVNVIVPVRMVEARYPGGLEAYFSDCPNGSYLQDEHLTRVGFMSTLEADNFVDELAHKGVHVSLGGQGSPQVAVVWDGRAAVPCDWLEVGECAGWSACWLKGVPPGPLVQWQAPRTYRCPAEIFEVLPALLYQAGFACRFADPATGDRLVCRRDDRRLVLDLVHDRHSREDGALFVFSDVGRVAGAPDDSAVLRLLDELLTGNGARLFVPTKA